MTLFAPEPEPSPAAPGAGQLAQTIAGLLAASRADGRQHAAALSHGLRLTVGTAEGEMIALSRKDGRPGEHEADIVAREAGWLWYGWTWSDHAGTAYLVVRPEDPPPDEPQLKVKQEGEPEEDPEYPDAWIRELLLDRVAPWRAGRTPGMLDIRDDAVKGMKRADLLEELRWLRRKFGPALLAWKRARIAAALG